MHEMRQVPIAQHEKPMDRTAMFILQRLGLAPQPVFICMKYWTKDRETQPFRRIINHPLVASNHGALHLQPGNPLFAIAPNRLTCTLKTQPLPRIVGELQQVQCRNAETARGFIIGGRIIADMLGLGVFAFHRLQCFGKQAFGFRDADLAGRKNAVNQVCDLLARGFFDQSNQFARVQVCV